MLQGLSPITSAKPNTITWAVIAIGYCYLPKELIIATLHNTTSHYEPELLPDQNGRLILSQGLWYVEKVVSIKMEQNQIFVTSEVQNIWVLKLFMMGSSSCQLDHLLLEYIHRSTVNRIDSPKVLNVTWWCMGKLMSANVLFFYSGTIPESFW